MSDGLLQRFNRKEFPVRVTFRKKKSVSYSVAIRVLLKRLTIYTGRSANHRELRIKSDTVNIAKERTRKGFHLHRKPKPKIRQVQKDTGCKDCVCLLRRPYIDAQVGNKLKCLAERMKVL